MAKKAESFFIGKLNLPKIEEKILDFWKANHIFEKTVNKNKSTKRRFVFYEGPPYANGHPGIHHVLARVFKDIILRYKTMKGFYVPRKAGWDTHGLPIEISAEKALNIKSKKEIEKLGVYKFNKKAKESIWIYKEEWEKLTNRIGYWLDLKNAYITYRTDYIESLWWIISQFAKKKLLYRGYKVVPWCPRCGTALSSHELAQGYKEVVDRSVYIKFKLKQPQSIGKFNVSDKTYILSWTTTPWTLPGNVALAVGENIKYSAVKIDGDDDIYILARNLINSVFENVPKSSIKIISNFEGKNMEGLSYTPLFDVAKTRNSKSHKIYPADFVTTEEGTGIVHIAVMYGDDDYNLGIKFGLPRRHTVDEEGRFTKDISGFSGMYVKDKNTEDKIFNYLDNRGHLFKIKKYAHDYPFCWRCGTPLIYYARNAWFVKVSNSRKKLLAENKKINWVPSHVKNGRFGEWLREAKDWNFSRERFWGTTLPVWECGECGNRKVVGSVKELSKLMGGSNNKYFAIRHGHSETQLLGINDCGEGNYNITPLGEKQISASAKKIKKENIDIIVSSDILRARQSADILSKKLRIKNVIFDKRLRDINLGKLSGKPVKEYHNLIPTYEDKFVKAPPRGESLSKLLKRVGSLIDDLENKYRGKNILIVSHEYTIWMIEHYAEGWDKIKSILEKEKRGKEFIKVGEFKKIKYIKAPRNEDGEIDLHRSYVDKVKIKCPKCGGEMKRVKDVVDVWFDSGSMPFASNHYPFENKNLIDKRAIFPADYISEGMDQTRGWFYTMLTVSTLLGKGAPYKNVIALGLIRDKFGNKMSKSKGNIVDPWDVINKYGIDAVRWYFYTSTPPGEPKNFSEEDILKIFRRFHLTLYNSLIFYKTYAFAGGKRHRIKIGKNVLDIWALSKYNGLVYSVSKNLDKYHIREAAVEIENFVNDLSKWYIRRSRRRFQKPKSTSDLISASETLGRILYGVVKMSAPFIPFLSEALYRELVSGAATFASGNREGKRLSVHLEDWERANKRLINKNVEKEMGKVRELASLALAKRKAAGIKVRQPLGALYIKKGIISSNSPALNVLRDEVNVKKVIISSSIKGDVRLDTRITAELLEEGILRDAVRIIQDLRQKSGFKPGEKAVLLMELPNYIENIILKNEKFIREETDTIKILYKKSDKFVAEADTKINDYSVWIGIRKA